MAQQSNQTGIVMPDPGGGKYIRWNTGGTNLENAATTVTDNGNFTASGTGAVARTVDSKLGEVVDIEDFGAVGDGTTDDTAKFTSAINALPSTGGSIRLDSNKTYLITGLTFTKPVHIYSDFRGEISETEGAIIKSTTNAAILTFATGSDWSVLENIGILGSTTGSSQHGIVQQVNKLFLRNVQVQPTGGDGIRVERAVSSTWLDVKVAGARGHGIHFIATGGAPLAHNTFFTTIVDSVQNSKKAIYYELAGGGDRWFGVNFESNTGDDLYIDNTTDIQMFMVHQETGGGNFVTFTNVGAGRNYIHATSYSQAVVDSGVDKNNIVTGRDVGNSRGDPWFLVGREPKITLRGLTGAVNFNFTADTSGALVINRGAVPQIKISSTGVVINEDGADQDFRVEGDTVTNLFVVDAGNETVSIGGGAGVKKHLSATASLDFDLSGAGITCQNLTITVTGAVDGDTVAIGALNALASTAGIIISGFVSAADTVTVRACDVTSGNPNPSAATVRADVWQY